MRYGLFIIFFYAGRSAKRIWLDFFSIFIGLTALKFIKFQHNAAVELDWIYLNYNITLYSKKTFNLLQFIFYHSFGIWIIQIITDELRIEICVPQIEENWWISREIYLGQKTQYSRYVTLSVLIGCLSKFPYTWIGILTVKYRNYWVFHPIFVKLYRI